MRVRGEIVAILASGPSMSQEVADGVREAKIPVIVTNTTWKRAPWADALFAADTEWWNAAAPSEAEFRGERFVSQAKPVIPGTQYIPKRKTTFGGGNSALRAAHMLDDLGAATILLYGVDLRDRDSQDHWHPPHKGLRMAQRFEIERQRRAWEVFARQPGRPEVLNCNPNSAVLCFPFHA